MKKILSTMLIMTSLVCFVSCSNDVEEIYIPQEVEFTLDYTFAESGSMTRATGEEIYSSFYDKYIKTKQLTPTTYSLTFTNKETGAKASVKGRWDKKDAIRLTEGVYEVTGSSVPLYKTKNGEPSDTAYLSFNETIDIKKDMSSLVLQAKYDSYFLMFDADNVKDIYYEHYYNTSSTMESKLIYRLYQAEFVRSMFIRDLNYFGDKPHYIYLTRNDGQKITITLDKFPFEKGKYYYFNDMTNSFDIPKMESGN